MAARPVPILILLAAAAAGSGGPTPLERDLQKRYLDRCFLLRAAVKLQRVRTETVVSSTVGGPPKLDEVKPITLVTEEGVFYSADYDSSTQVNLDVRPGPIVGGASFDDPALQNQALVNGGTLGSAIQIDRTAVVAIPEGSLARVMGVQEEAGGIRVTLEGLDGRRVPVLVRGAGTAAEPPEGRARAFDAILARLCLELPPEAADREPWIDPLWPQAVQASIRAGRVEAGMTPFQVILAWGNPVYVTRDPERQVEIWLYKRGATLMEQMRDQVNVYFAAGRVTQIEP